MEIGFKQVKTEDKKVCQLHCGIPGNYSLVFTVLMSSSLNAFEPLSASVFLI